MATITPSLDTRTTNKKGECRICLTVRQGTHKGRVSLGLSLNPSHWDSTTHCVLPSYRGAKTLNNMIARRCLEVEDAIAQKYGPKVKAPYKDIYNLVTMVVNGEDIDAEEPAPCFAAVMTEFADRKEKQSTRQIYLDTLTKIRKYTPEADLLKFEDIDLQWLEDFEKWMALTCKKNTRGIHLRNIRAVFNYAIDRDITTAYPFRRFRVRPEATRKRALTVEDLRSVISYPCEPHVEIYRDMFVLIFMLCGINAIDLHGLDRITRAGRIEYRREKTGRLYSIKVEPEARAIIEKYRGNTKLLCLADRWSDHTNFLHQCNHALQHLGPVKRVGYGGKKVYHPEWPELTTYWARHTWATIAAKLDIPKETIAAALGHGGNTVTDIYIDFDQSKVDDANRRVLDWVLYDRRR